jgi:Ca2+-binding RTX toxin-like protein
MVRRQHPRRIVSEPLEGRLLLAFAANGVTTTLTGSTIQQLSADRNLPGNTVAVWTGFNSVDGLGTDISVARMNSRAEVTGTLIANTTTTDVQQAPDVAVDPTGRFVVVWQSRDQDGSGWGVYARAFDANGNALTGEILVNQTTDEGQVTPAVAVSATGAFYVTWASQDIDGNSVIMMRRFAADGTPAGNESQVSAGTVMPLEIDPDIACDNAGNFVITWTRVGVDTGDNDVMYRGYNSAGSALYAASHVVSSPAGDQYDPVVAMSAEGNGFAIAWADSNSGVAAIEARPFDADGTALRNDITVHTTSGLERLSPRIDMDADGNFIIGHTALADTGSDAAYRWFTADGTGVGSTLTVSGSSQFRSVGAVTITGPGLFLGFTTRGPDQPGVGGATLAGYVQTLDVTSATSGNDSVLMTGNGANFSVTINNTSNTYRRGIFNRVAIDLGAGDDSFNGASMQLSLDIVGGDGADEIFGSLEPDAIDSGPGNDTVSSGAGNDYIFGGDNNDLLYGDEGNDTVSSGAGKNTLFGGAGNDRLGGSGGRESLEGGDGNDRLYGGGGSDTLLGGGNVDRLWGGAGDDLLLGGSSNDKLYGEANNDRLNGGKGADLIDGGTGTDVWEDNGDTTDTVESIP